MPAKFNILVAASIPLVPLIPLLACGGDSKSPDASIHVVDSPGSGSGSGSACHIASSLGTPTFTQQGAKYTGSNAQAPYNTLAWQGAMANQQAIEVLIFGGCGTTGTNCGGMNNATPDWPTTFGAKSNIDLATAGDALVAVLADPSGNTYQTIYFGVSGTLNVTQAGNAAGTTFAGNGANIVAQHYDIGSNSVTPDPDNCMTNITSFSWSGSAMFNGKVVVLDGTDRDAALRNYLTHRFQ